MFMISLTTLKLSYVLMIYITASLKVGSLPQSESFIGDKTVNTLDSTEKENFALFESFDSSEPCIIHIVACLFVTLLDDPFAFRKD